MRAEFRQHSENKIEEISRVSSFSLISSCFPASSFYDVCSFQFSTIFNRETGKIGKTYISKLVEQKQELEKAKEISKTETVDYPSVYTFIMFYIF